MDYYTQIGIIKETERTGGNHRLYSEEALTSIKVVRQLQEQHFSLEEISRLFRSNSDDLMEKTVCIKELLDELQRKVVEFYSAQGGSQTDENRLASREVIAKGLHVMQVLMVLLGEHIR